MKIQDVLTGLSIAALTGVIVLIATNDWTFSVASMFGTFVGSMPLVPWSRRVRERRTAGAFMVACQIALVPEGMNGPRTCKPHLETGSCYLSRQV